MERINDRSGLPQPWAPDSVPVVAIVRRLAPAQAEDVVNAIVEAGITVVEITADSAGLPDLLGRLRGALPAASIGVGTVLDASDVPRLVDAGAQFVVCPHVDVRIIAACADAGVPSMPGAATATEALTAWRAGASAVKLFPAGPLGPSTITALLDPLPMIPLVAVGGVDGANAQVFLDAGAVAVGLGSWLTCRGDADAAGAHARELVASLGGRRR
jgi:2-dehydro-3-deoxyphosphogluconate aldolase / (4S)-4-hydroxy-2-oxoglutarate aldolase